MTHVSLNRDWVIYPDKARVVGRDIRLGDTLHCGQLGTLVDGGVYVFAHPAISAISVHVPKDVVDKDEAFETVEVKENS